MLCVSSRLSIAYPFEHKNRCSLNDDCAQGASGQLLVGGVVGVQNRGVAPPPPPGLGHMERVDITKLSVEELKEQCLPLDLYPYLLNRLLSSAKIAETSSHTIASSWLLSVYVPTS